MKAMVSQMKLALVGPHTTAFNPEQTSFSLIRIAEQDVLEIENVPGGIVLNAKIYDETNQLVATIKKNVFHNYGVYGYEASSPDPYSIVVLNAQDDVVLHVRYLNPKAIKVLGIFHVPDRPVVVIEEGRVLVGKNAIGVTVCNVNSAPAGSWAQMKSAFTVP
jgi:hypothetical protein